MVTTDNQIKVGNLEWFYRTSAPVNPTKQVPIVLLHGLPAQSYSWRHVLPALSERGFWRSPRLQLQPPPPDSPGAPLQTSAGWLQIVPSEQQLDGFFMARLQRV
ncbi:MAG: hypothetical protein HC832_03665 [Leptolyngbyaceae cyanobacterium RM1_405_57]|nr:hypothetical protein [Leptolyngbyaceae cyanobacterium RM1_405_57]